MQSQSIPMMLVNLTSCSNPEAVIQLIADYKGSPFPPRRALAWSRSLGITNEALLFLLPNECPSSRAYRNLAAAVSALDHNDVGPILIDKYGYTWITAPQNGFLRTVKMGYVGMPPAEGDDHFHDFEVLITTETEIPEDFFSFVITPVDAEEVEIYD